MSAAAAEAGAASEKVLGEVLDALAGRGLPVAEVYAKRGRSRVVEESPAGVWVGYLREEGWAARAGDDRRSLFAAGTGAPDPAGPGGAWPEADGEALALPDPAALELEAERGSRRPGGRDEPGDAEPWREPPELDAPLLGEREALGLLSTLAEELRAELPAVRLLGARLADGASEWRLASRLGDAPGVEAGARSRAAYLRVEAALAERREVAAAVELAERSARAFDPRAIARRLADRLAVAARGSAPERDRGELVLAPVAAARLLAALAPLFVGVRGAELARRLEDRHGRFAAEAVTVIDDPRLAALPLAAPADGEGLPTAAAVLVEEGAYRRPLVPWWESAEAAPDRGRGQGRGRGRTGPRPAACARRPGWRDLPRPGPSQLYLAGDPETAPADLLAGVARGYYLLDADGPPAVDLAEGRLSLPVVGFAVERGRATAPLAGAALEGGIGSFLRGIDAVARDLAFVPVGTALFGAPTLHLTGMEIRRR